VTIEEISVADLAALGPGVSLVDVREDHEWEDSRIPYARHVVLATVPGRIEEFDGDPTYVVCRSGGRSHHACEFVAQQGRRVVNVAGGMMAWISAGFDTTSGAAQAEDVTDG
jgi:rhodanese-related sulfurtransferase